MKRGLLLLVTLLALTGCGNMGLGSLDTEEGAAFPGIDNMSAEAPEDKKSREWWDRFYGNKSSSEPDCDFYGNCKSQQKSGSWW